jgi:hypothetical protein
MSATSELFTATTVVALLPQHPAFLGYTGNASQILDTALSAGPLSRHGFLGLLHRKLGARLLRVFSYDALFDVFSPAGLAPVSLAGGALLSPGPCPACARDGGGGGGGDGAPPALLAARWLSVPPTCDFCGAVLQPRCAAGFGGRALPPGNDLGGAGVLLSLGAPLKMPPFSELAARVGAGCVVVDVRGESAVSEEPAGGSDAANAVAEEPTEVAFPADGGAGEEGACGSIAQEAFVAEWSAAAEDAGAGPAAASVAASVVVVASPLGADAAVEALAARLGWAGELAAEVARMRAASAAAMEAAASATAAAAAAAAADAAAAPPPLGGAAAAEGPGAVAAAIAAALAAAAGASPADAAEAEGRLLAAGLGIFASALEGEWGEVGEAEESFKRAFQGPE